MIMKKTYIHPEFELFEVETEGAILQGSINMGGDTDGDGEEDRVNPDGSDWEDLTNKRTPWGTSPWE